MTTVSLKLPAPLAVELAATARRRGMSQSALIRDALEAYLRKDGTERSGSALLQAVGLAGTLSGPADLSVNEDYLRKFGR